MALHSTTLVAPINGVSQQSDTLKFDNQVNEMINCHPHPVWGVVKRNPSILQGPVTADKEDKDIDDDVFIHTYDRGVGNEKYCVVVQDGYWRVYHTDSGLPVEGMDFVQSDYLTLESTPGMPPPKARDSYSLTTVGDTTFIVNKTKTTATATEEDGETGLVDDDLDDDGGIWNQNFFYWVKRTSGDSSNEYSYYIYNSTDSVAVVSDTGIDSTLIATELSSYGDDGTSKGSVVRYTEIDPGTPYTGADSWGNQASKSWQGTVKRLQDLPEDLGYPGTIIQIAGDDTNNFGNFWVKFEGGVYKETRKPGLVNRLDSDTLPQKLVRTETGEFTMSAIDWSERKVGDEDSAGMPSFVGNKISDVFFYKNRLGFLSKGNIIFSEVGEYYNFFPTSVTDVLDSDPIDVGVDSNHAVNLVYAVPYNKELLVFGEKAQFILSSEDTLTPKDVNIQQSTAYAINPYVIPRVIGPNVYFVTEKGESSIIREYFVAPDTSTNEAANVTAHCPEYVPKGIVKIAVSSRHDMLFAMVENSNKIYVYNFSWSGDEKTQSAWHTWELGEGEEVFNIDVIENKLLLKIKHTVEESGGPVVYRWLEKITLDVSDVDRKDVVFKDHQNYPGSVLGELGYDDTIEAKPIHSRIDLPKWGFSLTPSTLDSLRNVVVLRDLSLNMEDPSEYAVEVVKGGITRTYTNVRSTPHQAHRFPVTGNVRNLDVSIVSNNSDGFRLTSMSWRGQVFRKSTRSV